MARGRGVVVCVVAAVALQGGCAVERGADMDVVRDESGDERAHADADGDGLRDFWEFVYGSDPGRADTDGDGTCDGDEVIRGSDPADAGDDGEPLAASQACRIRLVIGDAGYGESELWALRVGHITLVSRGYGDVLSHEFTLRRGHAYPINVRHIGSKQAPPKSDYVALVQVVSTGGCGVVDDPSQMLGEHRPGVESGEVAKRAMLYLPGIVAISDMRMFNARPVVRILGPTGAVYRGNVELTGEVFDHVAPVLAVQVNGDEVAATPDPANPAQGPYRSTFTAIMDVGAPIAGGPPDGGEGWTPVLFEESYDVLAVNRIGQVGMAGVTLVATTDSNGDIRSYEPKREPSMDVLESIDDYGVLAELGGFPPGSEPESIGVANYRVPVERSGDKLLVRFVVFPALVGDEVLERNPHHVFVPFEAEFKFTIP